MSGILGIVFTDPDTAPDRPMQDWLAAGPPGRPPEGRVMTWESGGLAVHAAPGSESCLATRDVGGAAIRLAFHGALFDRSGASSADHAERLLEGYLREGSRFVTRLRGDFALAIWDGRDRSTHVSVDGFRVRPLFYHEGGGFLLFGSRLRSLAACPRFADRALSPEAVLDLVEASRIQTPRTIYRAVHKLSEGTILSFTGGRTRMDRYWRPDYRHPDPRPEAALQHEVRSLFQDAVGSRLALDGAARFGAYLSGGVDSTAVLGVLTRIAGGPVSCFSIAFDEPGFNELGFAQTAARAFAADHHVHHVTPREAIDVIPLLVDSFDEPSGNASAVPAYYCARLARDAGIQVLYAGDGGDEIFAGNEVYAARRVLEYYDRVPKVIRTLALEPASIAAGTLLPWGPFRKARGYVLKARVPYPERLGTYAFFRTFPKTKLFEPEFLRRAGPAYEPFAAQAELYREALATAELDRQLYVDLRHLITDSDLFKVTRTAEAAGVGVRFPFLDRPLVDFAASVPASLKMRGRRLRSFFKDAFRDLLPEETRRKQKHGFGLPIAIWMRNHAELRDLARDLVLGKRAMARGIFRRDGAEELFRLHEAEEGTSYYGPALWNMMMLECWLRAREDEGDAPAFAPPGS